MSAKRTRRESETKGLWISGFLGRSSFFVSFVISPYCDIQFVFPLQLLGEIFLSLWPL